MTFKPAVWFPIATALSALNLVGVGFAAASAEPWHAGIHATLGLAFGLWAQRLRRVSSGGSGHALEPRVEDLEIEMGKLRQELSETQERLDFAERVLAQPPETRRVGPHP
jgi:hypothetical protein